MFLHIFSNLFLLIFFFFLFNILKVVYKDYLKEGIYISNLHFFIYSLLLFFLFA